MDAGWMRRYCPGAQLEGPAVLEGYRFLINARGYASVVAAESSQVHGVLWRVRADHLEALDRYEGVPEGLYHRTETKVRSAGAPVRAWIYFARDRQPGRARRAYLEQILAAARDAELPEEYIEEIARSSDALPEVT